MRYNFPSSIHFSWGESDKISEHVKKFNPSRVLIVTDPDLVKIGLLEHIMDHLREAGHEFIIYEGVQPNPTITDVEDGHQIYLENDCDMIVAIGGGSPMDAAKGILVLANHQGKIEDYFSGASNLLPVTGEVPPFIAIPTTSGTGSETSRGAIITDKTNRKRALSNSHLLPGLALLDPRLSATMPPKLTAHTGLDALSHNLEAFVVDRYAPICDAFAFEGIQLVASSLERAYREGGDKGARMDMMMSSTMGALAFQKGLGVVHSLAHQLSTQCNIPHGAACGIMMPHAVKFNLENKKTHGKFAKISEIFGFEGKKREQAEHLPDVLNSLLEKLEVPTSLSDWGVKESDITVMAENAILDWCHPRNPRGCTLEDMKNLYHEAV